MDERSLPTSDCKLQAFYAMNVRMDGLLRAARNDKAAGFLYVTCNKVMCHCEAESRGCLWGLKVSGLLRHYIPRNDKSRLSRSQLG